jgi:hypothetical protein
MYCADDNSKPSRVVVLSVQRELAALADSCIDYCTHATERCFQIRAGRRAPLACIPLRSHAEGLTHSHPLYCYIRLEYTVLFVLPLTQPYPPSPSLVSFVHPRKCDHHPGVGASALETHDNLEPIDHLSRVAELHIAHYAALQAPVRHIMVFCLTGQTCSTPSYACYRTTSVQETRIAQSTYHLQKAQARHKKYEPDFSC